MYRRTRKYQDQVDRMARARAAKERKRLGKRGYHPDTYPPELPALRRVIEITDFDSGTPVTHHFELYRTSRVDCYNVWIDGKLWKERIGWSRILERLRKALPRLTHLASSTHYPYAYVLKRRDLLKIPVLYQDKLFSEA